MRKRSGAAWQTQTASFWISSIIVLALLGVALWVRLPGDDGRALWIDEIWRAALILDPHYWHDYFFAPSVETAITSPLYALLVKTSSLISITPTTLRLSSLLPGLAAVALVYALIGKAKGSTVLCALAGLLFAANESFIDYSNEMKPYMFEVCVHLGCFYAWLSLITSSRPTARIWSLFLTIATLAIFSTPTIIFVLPAFGITLFTHYVVNRDWKNIKITILGFGGLSAAVAALYVLSWRHGDSGGMLTYWADGFRGVNEDNIHFIFSRFLSMWRMSFTIFLAWPLPVLSLVVVAMLAVSIVAAQTYRRVQTRNVLLFYLVFFPTLCAINALHLWPLGPLRPNLFLYAMMALLPFLLATEIPGAPSAAWACFIGAALFLMWQFHSESSRGRFEKNVARLHDRGAPIEQSDLVAEDFSYGGRIGKSISANCASGRTLVIADGFMAGAIDYYEHYDRALRNKITLLHSRCVQLVPYLEAYQYPDNVATAALSKIVQNAPEAWLLYTHYDEHEAAIMRNVAAHFGTVTQSHMYQNAGYFELTRRAGEQGQTVPIPSRSVR